MKAVKVACLVTGYVICMIGSYNVGKLFADKIFKTILS